jgi:hypothetical protein
VLQLHAVARTQQLVDDGLNACGVMVPPASVHVGPVVQRDDRRSLVLSLVERVVDVGHGIGASHGLSRVREESVRVREVNFLASGGHFLNFSRTRAVLSLRVFHCPWRQHSATSPHAPSITGCSGTGSEERVPRRSSSSTAASGPSDMARNMPTRCHSSATCAGVAPSASSAVGLAPARSSAKATVVRPSCAAYLWAVAAAVLVIAEVAVTVVVGG